MLFPTCLTTSQKALKKKNDKYCESHLPVDVEAVKAVFPQEVDGVIHELAHAELVGDEFLPGLGAQRPASQGHHHLRGTSF